MNYSEDKNELEAPQQVDNNNVVAASYIRENLEVGPQILLGLRESC